MAQRVVLHADMDAFYASVEQRDDPSLRGRPVVVGGTSSRGVVTAASYEARRYGIHSAMPSVEARRRCPDAVFVRGDMARYGRESRRIFSIFRRFTPKVEGLSLDEAFLDLTGCERLLGPPAGVGQRLRETVRKETGLAVSVGIAPVKLVAKIASDLAKPDGLLEVGPDEVRDFLAPLPVGRMWGIGPVTEARLEAAGFTTLGQLAETPGERLVTLLGELGATLGRRARGEDARDVEPSRAPVSYSEENTFGSDMTDLAPLVATARSHAESVARRIRRDGWLARTVVLKLKLARRRAPGPRGYPILTRRTTLARPTDDGHALGRAACTLLERALQGRAIRLLGVGVTNLVRHDAGQLALFGDPAAPPDNAPLNRALDALADRFGPGAVVRAGDGQVERVGLSLARKGGTEPEEEPD